VRRHRDEHHDDRQRQAVVQPGFHVEQPSQPERHVGASDDRGGEHRVGRGQDGAERKLAVQSIGVSALVSRAMPMKVSGMPRPSARPAVAPVAFNAGNAARMPSV